VRPPYNISVLNSEARCSRWSTRTCSPPRPPTCAPSASACRRRWAHAKGVKAWPSDANMILVRVPDPARSLRRHEGPRVLVKNVSRMHPLLAGCLRLTVGTADENTQMLAALQASL
jgi:histidinol-phosphate aminotransferase